MKALLWDIDGTLINSGGAGSRALRRACHDLHGIPDAESMVRLDGMTDRAIVREILRKHFNRTEIALAEIDAVLQQYLAYLREEVPRSESYLILPGIMPILQNLIQRDDFILLLATGNLREGAAIKLERGKLNVYFRDGGFGSDSENRPELVQAAHQRAEKLAGRKIAPDDVFVIGDTHHDINAGKALGLRTVAVATGSYSEAHLANCKPDYLFKDFSETQRVLDIFS